MSWISGLVVRIQRGSRDIAERLGELGADEAQALARTIGEDTEPEEFANTLSWARGILLNLGDAGDNELLSRADAELEAYSQWLEGQD